MRPQIRTFGAEAAWRTPPALAAIHPSLRAIKDEVCRKHRISPAQLSGPTRARDCVAARFEAMWRMARETGASLNQIGRQLGGRHHTTVLHGIRAYEKNFGA